MTVVREYRRVLLEDLNGWIAAGWHPAREHDGAVGAVPVCDGALAEVLIWKEVEVNP